MAKMPGAVVWRREQHRVREKGEEKRRAAEDKRRDERREEKRPTLCLSQTLAELNFLKALLMFKTQQYPSGKRS